MKEKVGLVLEGGGMRGMYTAGVLDVFMENGLLFDGVIGVSAGALNGSSYISQQIGRTIRYNVKFAKDDRYISWKSFFKTGNICDKEFCFNELPNKHSYFDFDTFKEVAKFTPFYVVCTNLETGKAEYIRCHDMKKDMEYLRASASLPLVSKPSEIGGRKLLDGGTADSVPISQFIKMGFKKNIVILTRPEGYLKKKDSAMPILKRVYKEYPNYIQSSMTRHINYNESMKKLEILTEKKEAYIIRPSRNIKIGRLEKDADKLKKMYKLGRYDAAKKLSDIKAFI